MRPASSSIQRLALLASLLGAAVLLASCGEEVVVRQDTRVYRDGSLYRTLEISGRESDGEAPSSPDWFREKASLILADPDGWGRVEEHPGRLVAAGSFTSPDQVPVALTHLTDDGPVSDRTRLDLQRDDLVILERWRYEETRGDPYSYEDLESTLDGMMEFTALSLREEIRKELGPEIDTASAEAFLRREARAVVGDLMGVLRQTLSINRDEELERMVIEVMGRHEVVPLDGSAILESSLEDQLEIAMADVLRWARRHVAGKVSTPEHPVDPEELSFWPDVEDVLSIWDNPDEAPPDERAAELKRLAKSMERTLSGYYGDGGSPRFRFESRLEMPGRLLRTNGTATESEIIWLFRNMDLTLGDVTLSAESVELDLEALASLGARHDFDTRHLLQLTDILTLRDPEGGLRDLLVRAVEKGRLDLLRDDDEVPEGLEQVARELADLLDPSLRPWPP